MIRPSHGKTKPITDPMLKTSHLKTNPLLVYGVKNGSLMCEMKSNTEPVYYRMAVRVSDGACACECKAFEMKWKHRYPTIYSGQVCRHLSTYREFLQRELLDLTSESSLTTSY